MESSYSDRRIGATDAPSGVQQGKEPSFMEAFRSELDSLEAMASGIAANLHDQADRLIGPEPEKNSEQQPPVGQGAPTFMLVVEQLGRIRAYLHRANAGARRLRKIG